MAFNIVPPPRPFGRPYRQTVMRPMTDDDKRAWNDHFRDVATVNSWRAK